MTTHGRPALYALTDVQFALLRDLILERTGMHFDESKRGILVDKLSELIASNGMTSFLDYYYLLRYDDNAEAHWDALMNRLSVPETFFWRQSEQILSLSQVVAPAHFGEHREAPMRIWSAACCTGEEPLSIAIALAEVGLLDASRVEIRATDGSPAMVERARKGRYGARSFRQLPEDLRDRYFERDGDYYRPIERIRNAVTYDVVNLARPEQVAPYASADVIFCRNVFIYFSDTAIKGVVECFAQHMPRDGCVFLGAAESLTRLDVELQLAEIGGAFAYVKDGGRRYPERGSGTPQVPAPGIKDVSWRK